MGEPHPELHTKVFHVLLVFLWPSFFSSGSMYQSLSVFGFVCQLENPPHATLKAKQVALTRVYADLLGIILFFNSTLLGVCSRPVDVVLLSTRASSTSAWDCFAYFCFVFCKAFLAIFLAFHEASSWHVFQIPWSLSHQFWLSL